MNKSLFLRTEVLPEELPILFSNKNVFLPFHKKKMKEYSEVLQVVNSIATVPYYFEIPKDKYSNREMSLLHPLAQLQAYIYTLTYEHLIIEFCSRSKFSARSPSKLNSFQFDKIKGVEALERKLNETFSFSKKINISSEEDKSLFFNYYSYRPYKAINDLHKSPKFNRQKYKYDFFIKLDIQNFFPSIYSHAIAWAIFGNKAIAKQNRNKELFANATDGIAQLINFDETNGLVVGPEFSRVIAELLLTRIDIELYHKLKKESVEMYRDYVINRYIDDFYIFTNTEQTAILIEKKLSQILSFYNLGLNVHKRQVQRRPFKIYNKSIVKLNSILAEFHTKNVYSFIRYQENITMLLEFQMEEKDGKEKRRSLFIPPTKFNWQTLFYQIEKLLYENEDDSRRIVNYFLKAIRDNIVYEGGSPWDFAKVIEIVTSVYSLDINHQSTYSVVSIYIKIWLDITDLEATALEKDNKHMLVNIDRIKENIFHNIYSTLKNNFGELDQMHDLIVFMKQIDKQIDSQFLCKILNEYKENYFVLCSVAYYILNDDLKEINSRYKTVCYVLRRSIHSFRENYKPLGARHLGLEGHYFYIINDFSHYPGFEDLFRRSLERSIESTFAEYLSFEVNNNRHFQKVKQRIQNENSALSEEEINNEILSEKETRKKNMEAIWGYVTQRSYFQWQQNAEQFSRRIVKKTLNISFKSPNDY